MPYLTKGTVLQPPEGSLRVKQVNTYKRNWLGRRVWVDSHQYLQQFRDGEWRELDIHVEDVDL